MMEPPSLKLAADLALLRTDFDRIFAEPPAERAAAAQDLLAVRVGGDAYALRLSEITHFSALRPLAPVPGSPPAFLGLSGFKGELLPVWNLAALLGYSAASPRWTVLCAGAARWGAAFDGFDGYLKAERGHLSPLAGEGRASAFADEVFDHDGLLRPVLKLSKALPIIQKGSDR